MGIKIRLIVAVFSGNGQQKSGSHQNNNLSLLSLSHPLQFYQDLSGSLISSARRLSTSEQDTAYCCTDCKKYYRSKTSLNLHKRWECGKEPKFLCPFCPKRCHQKGNLKVHIHSRHRNELELSNGIAI